jgi:hypothetical protein
MHRRIAGLDRTVTHKVATTGVTQLRRWPTPAGQAVQRPGASRSRRPEHHVGGGVCGPRADRDGSGSSEAIASGCLGRRLLPPSSTLSRHTSRTWPRTASTRFLLDEAHLLHQNTLDHLHILLNVRCEALMRPGTARSALLTWVEPGEEGRRERHRDWIGDLQQPAMILNAP